MEARLMNSWPHPLDLGLGLQFVFHRIFHFLEIDEHCFRAVVSVAVIVRGRAQECSKG